MVINPIIKDETLSGASLATTLNPSHKEIPTSQAVLDKVNLYYDLLTKGLFATYEELTYRRDNEIGAIVEVGVGSSGETLIHMSYQVPTLENIEKGCYCLEMRDGQNEELTFVPKEDMFIDDSGAISMLSFTIIPEDNFQIQGLTFPKRGIYFSKPNIMGMAGIGLLIPSITLHKDIVQESFIKVVTLPASSWDTTTLQLTVDVIGITADLASQMITISPDTSQYNEYLDAGILCIKLNTGSLTFSAEEIPSSDFTVYVAIQNCR